MIIEALAFNFISISQTVDTNIKGLTIESRIVLFSQADSDIKVQGLHSSLHLAHVAKLSKTVKLTANNILVFSQVTYPRVNVRQVTSWIYLISDFKLEDKFLVPKHSLLLDQDVTVSVAKGTYSTLALTQNVQVRYTRNLSTSSSLTLSGPVTGYLPSKYWFSYDIDVVAP